jgi:ATP-binding cassette, subfamily B, bacterial MsbA
MDAKPCASPQGADMKNLLRALRFAWPYRGRFLLSILCAIIVAALWGANFSAIYPVLYSLGRDTNMQTWAAQKVENYKDTVEKKRKEVEEKREELRRVGEWPSGKERERRIVELNGEIARLLEHQSYAQSQLNWCGLAKFYIDRYCPTDRFETLVWLLVLVICAMILKGIFDFCNETLVGSVVHRSMFDLRNRFYRNTLRLDVAQFTKEGSHELLARFTNDMEALAASTKTIFGKSVTEPLKVIAFIALACFISWRLTLLFIIAMPLALLLMSRVAVYMKKAGRRVLGSMTSLYKIVQESFQGIKVVKAFTTERQERLRLYVGARDYARRGMHVIVLEALSGPIMEVLASVAVAGALLVGAYLVLYKGTHIFGLRMTYSPLEMEELIQLYALLLAIADPVRKLSSSYSKVQAGAAAADRIFDFMDRKPYVQSNPFAPRLERHERSIEFREVCFSYNHGTPILSHINLKVEFGQTIALVGHNGCGKTTLVGLLARFMDPDYGSILIDGVDHREVRLRSLRQQISLVTQETVLFDDTVFNNIAYGRHKPLPEEVEEAAKKAYAHDFIMRLPLGYQTRIHEMGVILSGGQRQRLALARAILRNPTILILDEATSAADLESEALIHRALKEFTRNRTTFIITHRLSTLEIADRIVVMNQGRIEAVGRHDDLIVGCETYKRLNDVPGILPVVIADAAKKAEAAPEEKAKPAMNGALPHSPEKKLVPDVVSDRKVA